MTLAPEIQPVLQVLAQLPTVDFAALAPLEAARRMRAGSPPALLPADADIVWEDIAIGPGPGEVPARIYRPSTERPTGVLVNYHGGGWVLGSVASDDARCRTLQRATGAIVVSVDYRLAPEHPFPAPLEDCFAAVSWAHDHLAELAGPNASLAVTGSSAGANLAAAAAILARDTGIPLALQLLICPVTDYDFETASYVHNAEGYFLTRTQMQWFWDQYAPGDLRRSPLAAMLRHDHLAGLAPAHVIVAEYDPLRDDGISYAERLRCAGVATTLQVRQGMLHSFTSLAPQIPQSQQTFREIGVAVRNAFASR